MEEIRETIETADGEEYQKNKRFWRTYYSVHNISMSVLLLLLMIFGMLIGDIMALAAGVVCGIALFIATNHLKNKKFHKNKPVAFIYWAIALALIVVFFLTAGPVSSKKPKYYKLQRAWVNMKYKLDKDFLPKELVGNGYYRLDAMPSIMQGSGWVSVCSWYDKSADMDAVNKLIEDYKSRAISSFKLSDYADPDIGATLNAETVSIYCFTQMWADYAENATVYVLDSHGTGNHPHSTVFIIDEKDGIMEFSKLG